MDDAQSGGTIRDSASLRRMYAPPVERAVRKSLTTIDRHMREFIALSPFVVLGTSSAAGADVTPRGARPGFVQVLDDTTLLLPDWPGNNRLDALSNLVSNPQVGLLFLIPGVEETLRVNGVAEISVDPDLLARWDVDGKHPRSVLKVLVREAFLHCAKASVALVARRPRGLSRSAAHLRQDAQGSDRRARHGRADPGLRRGELRQAPLLTRRLLSSPATGLRLRRGVACRREPLRFQRVGCVLDHDEVGDVPRERWLLAPIDLHRARLGRGSPIPRHGHRHGGRGLDQLVESTQRTSPDHDPYRGGRIRCG
jgi:PPOX class probable FMN-dependent enzyme